VKGYVETLRDDIKENRFESASHYLDVIARNVDRLNTLMNDLLDLSSLESGAELNVAPFQVREVTEQTVKLLESKRLEKNHIINCQFKIEHLIADVRRVEQVLVNLVENALKYIPPGGQVDIYWEQDPKGARLRVVDNGPGIPYEHQPRLFERFYRLDSGRSRDLGGTGLGLSIVKHIMMKHGGTVRLLSHPGRGCEFICIFPQDV
jgi:two-component system phosphate regulon sensor histidine kinase PhoR